MLSADPSSFTPSSSPEEKKPFQLSVPHIIRARLTQWTQRLRIKLQPALNDAAESTEKELIENIEDLGQLTVEDVMVPRVDISALEINATRDEFLELIKVTPHSRIPIYQNNLDDVVGFVHIKDVMRMMAQNAPIILSELLRPIMIVSPALPALELLVEMRRTKRHVALVVDEYGGIDGLVTMGDLIEAIIGEMDDEHNTPHAPRLIHRSDDTVTVDARYTIDAFEEKFGECFGENERQEADTLGGLIMFMAGHLPQRGEVFTHSSGIILEVLDADPRRVKRLRLRNLPSRVDVTSV